MNDYRVSNRYKYQHRLKFRKNNHLDDNYKGKKDTSVYNIKVKYADDPVNVNWANLEVTPFESFWRSFVTVVLAVVSSYL